MRAVSYEQAGRIGVGELEEGTIHPLEATDIFAWLSGEGTKRSGETVSLRQVNLLAPVPQPPSIRNFLVFGNQLEALAKRRGSPPPKQWREAPAFHFSNPASVRGPDTPVLPPSASKALDFEVEIAAVVGAGSQIAGFALMCDWTARDLEHRELAIGFGPHKSKDFATSLGPWLVPADSLPYADGQLDLDISVAVNGRRVSRCSSGPMRFSWPELLVAAARGTRLIPGDILASGALPGGSLVELGREALDPSGEEPWLMSGDDVTISCEHLGELSVPIA